MAAPFRSMTSLDTGTQPPAVSNLAPNSREATHVLSVPPTSQSMSSTSPLTPIDQCPSNSSGLLASPQGLSIPSPASPSSKSMMSSSSLSIDQSDFSRILTENDLLSHFDF